MGGGKFFFEMNISLTFYHDLSWVRLAQSHFLGPKIAFTSCSYHRPDSLERGLSKSLPPESLWLRDQCRQS